MDPAWWSADRELTEARVAALVARQFPALAGRALRKLGEGWDSDVYDLGGEWILRFPKRAQVQEALAKERALLPRLSRVLPLPIPNFELFGVPCEEFPYDFVGYRKLYGVSVQETLDVQPEPAARQAIAQQLGEFLSALHAFDASGIELPRSDDEALDAPLGDVHERLVVVRRFDPELASRIERSVKALEPPPLPEFDPTLIHRDLDVEHILIDESLSRLTAVIDWGDAEVGLPLCDFVGAYGFGGERFVEQVLAYYHGPDIARHLPWIRQRAIRIATGNIAYGYLSGFSSYIRAGLHSLGHALRD